MTLRQKHKRQHALPAVALAIGLTVFASVTFYLSYLSYNDHMNRLMAADRYEQCATYPDGEIYCQLYSR